MLMGIHSALTPDLLRYLRAMGHGDTLVIADANFPADSCAKRIERLAGVNASDALQAILSLMPLDSFIETPVCSMQVVGDPNAVPDVVADFQTIVNEVAQPPAKIVGLERFDFYTAAKEAYCIIQTAETRLYGNLILQKGIVAPEQSDV